MPSLDRAAIDPDADRVVRKLNRAGHKAYLVGGCVRDLLLGRTPKDFDVATSATPNEIKAIFRNTRIIGRRFRLAHVYFGSKNIETATFRANPRDDDDHDLLIRRDNVFGTETEDARRRRLRSCRARRSRAWSTTTRIPPSTIPTIPSRSPARCPPTWRPRRTTAISTTRSGSGTACGRTLPPRARPRRPRSSCRSST